MTRTGPYLCSDCGERWPPNLAVLLEARGGCPACQPDTYGATEDEKATVSQSERR